MTAGVVAPCNPRTVSSLVGLPFVHRTVVIDQIKCNCISTQIISGNHKDGQPNDVVGEWVNDCQDIVGIFCR